MSCLLIGIPMYNCRNQIKRVIEDLRSLRLDQPFEIWLVDNQSSDGTLSTSIELLQRSEIRNVRVFQNSYNVNLGGTQKLIFRAAATRGFTHVVIFHGDDQPSVGDISRVVEHSIKRGGMTTLGTRFSRNSNRLGYQRARVIGNYILNVLYSCLFFRRLSDLGSGLNVFRVADLEMIPVETFSNSLTFNYELLLGLLSRRVQFDYVPISWKEHDQISNARNIQIFFTAVNIALSWRLGFRTQRLYSRSTRFCKLDAVMLEKYFRL